MVKLRKYRRRGEPTGEWEVDVRVELPNGEVFRQRVVYRDSPSKVEARTWAEEREHHVKDLARQGLDLERIRRALRRGKEGTGDPRTMTVESAIEGWLVQRKAEAVATFNEEAQRLREHVVPVIGNVKVVDVRPKHAYQLVKHLERTPSRRGGVLAPRTVRNVFFATRQVFQHLVLEEVLAGNPMVVARGVLPRVQDKDPTWRAKAVFTAAEVEQLISDERIAPHRRVAYAIEFLTGFRTGQASALTWGDYELDVRPLGRITSALAYNSKRKVVKETKTGATHEVPVHPTLAKVLATWKLTGWRKRMSRSPRADDLIIPTVNGTHRDVRKALEDFHEDLERLGLRRRRHYDSRRTFISLGLDGGASKDILQNITHPRPADAFDLYRTPAWEARCDAVLKLRVLLREGRVISLHPEVAVNGGGGVEAELVVAEAEKEKAQRTVPLGL